MRAIGSRTAGLLIGLLLLALTQWAFRFHLPESPVDSFMRLLVLITDGLALIPMLGLLLSGNKGAMQAIRLWTGRHPNLTAAYIGLVMTFGAVLTVEFGCRFYFKRFYQPPYHEVTNWDPAPNPSRAKGDTICHQYIINDTVIYDLKYAIDTLARRHVPLLRPDSTYNEFALLQVCSFPFGFGLSDNQTFARSLDSICGVRPYNYSISGRGPQHIAAMLHTRDLRSEIRESNGRLIYLYIDDHMLRLIGSRRLIKMWAAKFPYFYLENDELRWNSTFIDGRPGLTAFYQVISNSAFIDLFDIEIPPVLFQSHLRLAAKVLARAKEEFHWHYPDGEFLVVVCPGSGVAPRLAPHLQREGIPYLDYSRLIDLHDPAFKIHWTEGHPNGKYYQCIAQELNLYFQEHPLP